MRRTKLTIVGALVAALAIAAPTAGVTSSLDLRADATRTDGVLDTQSAIVILKQAPVATYDGQIKGYEKTRVPNGKVNPNSAAAKKYLGYLKSGHSAFAKWLQTNVPSAKITSEYFTVLNGVAVTLNGAAIGKLRQNADVLVVEYNALYRPTMSESYKLINALAAWGGTEAGRAQAGHGVKVGIIDSGIDSSHPFFDPTGFSSPEDFPKCDVQDSATGEADHSCRYVTDKVIVAKVFNNKLNQRGFDANPIPGVGDHGTHVSGTVAGVVGKTALVNGVSIDDMSGIAPAAWLGNYNVFPGTVENARSEDILNAVEAAVLDGMDVLNLSLGGGYHGNNDLLAKGLDTAVAAGVVVVTSAGNEGPGPFTIGSPGRARDIITVGASTNQHFVGQPVSWNTGTVGDTMTVGAAVGDFPALAGATFDLVVALKSGALDDACAGLATAPSGVNLQAVLVTRGTCSFSIKVRAAKAAGYEAVLVRNNVAGDPTAMAKDGLGNDDWPAVMLSRTDGDALRAAAPATVTATATFDEFVTDNGDILAGFSSQGPTFVDYAIKPDLTSVGVNVLSSVAGGGTDGNWAFFSGTSMSSPHVTGSAAVLLALHDWTPAQVKSALVNTADLVVKDASTGAATVGPMAQGAGRENLGHASTALVSFSPVSASFGRTSASKNTSTTTTITIDSDSRTNETFSLSAKRFTPATGLLGSVYNGGTAESGDTRISFPPTVTVPAGGITTFTITVNAGLPKGTVVQGWLEASASSDTYRIAYWAEVGP